MVNEEGIANGLEMVGEEVEGSEEVIKKSNENAYGVLEIRMQLMLLGM